MESQTNKLRNAKPWEKFIITVSTWVLCKPITIQMSQWVEKSFQRGDVLIFDIRVSMRCYTKVKKGHSSCGNSRVKGKQQDTNKFEKNKAMKKKTRVWDLLSGFWDVCPWKCCGLAWSYHRLNKAIYPRHGMEVWEIFLKLCQQFR